MSHALRVSVAANVALAGLVALLWFDGGAAPARDATPSRASGPVARDRAQRADPHPTATDRAPRAAPQLTPALLARIEQLGLSRDVVVSGLLADFQRRWDRRVSDMEKRYAPRPVPEREYVELARLRETEQVRELREVLGEDGYLAWDMERTLQAVNSAGAPLTDAEAREAYRLQKEFEQLHRELEMAMEDGVADKADAAALQAQAQANLERDLERLFGRERLAQMRGYRDPIANVQWRFGDLGPSPAQAAAVVSIEAHFRAQEATLTQRLRGNRADPETITAELAALRQAREDQLRRIFGPDAYEQHKRQTDPTYQTLQQYAGTWALQGQEVDTVYQHLRAFHDQAEQTRTAAALRESAGEAVNWREINQAIDEARQKTESRLQTIIGLDRVRRLKQNGLLLMR